ncbi:ogfod2, partial [Symbiodinium necroappetens]
MKVSAAQTSGASQTVTSVRAACGLPWAPGQLPQAPQMLHGVHSFVPVVMRAVVPRRVEPVVMEPVVVVQRQFSAPCLVRKASLTAPAAPPGQGHGFVQPEGAATRAKVEAVCVPAEPLPTWAAPATPPQPQGLRVSPSYEKPENDSETGIPDGSERNGLASESQDEEAVEAVAVSEKDFSRMRAKLEATRNELVEKMAELMKLEANLSVALGEKPTAWSCLPSSEPAEPAEPAEASDAAMHATSLSAQSSIEMQDRAIGVVAEEYECESSVASFQAPEKGCNTRAVGTTTDDLMATASDDNVKDLNTSQTDKKDASRSDTARSAPSRAGSGGSGSSGRVSALLNAPPVSARLSLRRRGSQTAKEASPDTKEFGELSGLRRSASATMANKLRRSSSAKELTGGNNGLLASDVARLVASPEIGTLNDFLPHPIPEPEVLRESSAEASASNAHVASRQKRASAKAPQAKEMQRSSSEARIPVSRASSREAASREVKPRLPQTASNERSTGSRMPGPHINSDGKGSDAVDGLDAFRRLESNDFQ